MEAKYDFSQGKRSPVYRTPLGKMRIATRLDDDFLV
jgi:hypothetical protein